VVLADAALPPADAARTLFDHCLARMAYFKAPGWMWITDRIPTTATQKVQKHALFPSGTDPRQVAGMIDLRALKKRKSS
jgi:crotonobetaine/carnitine-CoA ligase